MWFYKDQLFDTILDEFDSFVYLIERLNLLEDSTSPIYYIGKKTFYYKGKYKGKRIITESDWWDYYGSSEWLNSDIQKYGKHNFKRTILHLCRTKGDSGYLEAKEQIDRNVLHIEPDGYKLYYNKNIIGRYRKEPEFYLLEKDLKEYFNLDYVHGKNLNKVKINNSKENRIVSKSIARELVNTGNWCYGMCEKHLEVNDGVTNFTIPKSQFDEKTHTLGHIKKYITNGLKDKLLPVHEIDEFIKNNSDWYIGHSKNNNDIWITNGIDDLKIKREMLNDYPDYRVGKTKTGVKNKVSIFKNDEFKWVLEEDADNFLKNGWVRKGQSNAYNLYIVTNNVNQKHFRDEGEKNEFLSNNPEWRDGQLHRDSFNAKDLVFAKDMRTDEKVTVSSDEYNSNKFLTSIKTKKIKVKKKGRVVFIGYIDLFLLENPQYPKTHLMNALRSKSGDVYLKKGKNTWLNEEKLNLRWL